MTTITRSEVWKLIEPLVAGMIDDARLSGATAAGGGIGGGGISDHGALTGLTDDDHSQYLLADGTRGLTGNWNAGDYNISLGGNLGLGVTAWGTNADQVIGIGNGTAPTTQPVDMVQMWAADYLGTSALHITEETGSTVRIGVFGLEILNSPSSTYNYYLQEDGAGVATIYYDDGSVTYTGLKLDHASAKVEVRAGGGLQADFPAVGDVHIYKGIVLEAAAATLNGTIQYTGTDFEGRVGGAWVSLTSVGGVTDHGGLTGLTDDDHSIYALLAGRSGGQTLYGGTGGGNNLTLRSTSHATRGYVDVVDDLLLSFGTQDYLYTSRSTALVLQGQTSGISSGLEFFNKDGDGTDSFSFVIWGVGTPTSVTNRERMIFGWRTGPSAYEIFTEAGGTGTVRPLSLYTTGNSNQLHLDASGNIGFNAATFGTSAAKVLAIANGTAPTTQPVDMVQMWAADYLGTSALHITEETGSTVRIGVFGLEILNSPSSTYNYYLQEDGAGVATIYYDDGSVTYAGLRLDHTSGKVEIRGGGGLLADFAAGQDPHIYSGIQLEGTAGSATAGKVDWDGSNFRGYNGSGWVDLDKQGTVLGSAGAANRIAYWSAADTIDDSADLVWNDTNKTLSIGQGVVSNAAISLQQDNVAHGMTGLLATDVYGQIAQTNGDAGGLRITGAKDAGAYAGGAVLLVGYLGEAPDTTEAPTSTGIVEIEGYEKSGTSVINPTGDDNLFVVSAGSGAQMILKANGDLWVNGLGTLTTFDDHDDVALLHGFRAGMMPVGHELRARWGANIEPAREVLEAARVVSGDFLNVNGLLMVAVDAIRQLGEQNRQLEDRLRLLEAA